jgi:hypothetical protein
MHIVLFHPCKEYLYFVVKYNFYRGFLYFTHSMALASCAFLPGQECTTLARSSCLAIRCFFMFGAVRDLTQEHLATTVTPLKWRDGSSQNDDIDAEQSATASDLDQYSRSVRSGTRSAARRLIGFITWY